MAEIRPQLAEQVVKWGKIGGQGALTTMFQTKFLKRAFTRNNRC